MTSPATKQEILWNAFAARCDDPGNLAKDDIELIGSLVRSIMAWGTASPADAPGIARKIVELMVAPAPADLRKLTPEQLACLERAELIKAGHDSGAEPETNNARDRIAAKLNTIAERADTLHAAELAKVRAELAAVIKLNEALEARLAYQTEAA
jgi:hypothetical protein